MLPEYRSVDRHPFVSLLHLVLVCIIGGVVFTIFGALICYLFYGKAVMAVLSGGAGNIQIFKIVQLFSSVGTFILPALLFAKQESGNSRSYLKLNKNVSPQLIVLATIIVFLASGFIDWTIEINQMMKLPSFLAGLEEWMKKKENQLEIATRQLLVMKTVPDLLGNFVLIAVIPALGEEFVFRGCLQKILGKWTNNPHLAIWIAAAIFSAIHIQFYGFLPRMLLGALFGYLFFWSRNLWIPIIAHFINNGTAVAGAWLMQQRGESIGNVSRTSQLPSNFPVFSLILTLGLLAVFYRLALNQHKGIRNEQHVG